MILLEKAKEYLIDSITTNEFCDNSNGCTLNKCK